MDGFTALDRLVPAFDLVLTVVVWGLTSWMLSVWLLRGERAERASRGCPSALDADARRPQTGGTIIAP